MAHPRPLRGYYPIMATPYTAANEVDLASVRRLVDYLIDNGAHGMSPNGGDSEAQNLSLDERKAVLDAVLETCAGRAGVLVGTSTVDVADAVELHRHASAAGADAVFVHPGWGRSGLRGDEVLDYYRRIAEVCTIPIMVHGTSDIDVDLLQRLADEIPSIAYVKEETTHGPKLRRYVRDLGQRLTVFGPGLHYPGELGWGALGVMPSCAAPRAHSRVFDLWQEGRHAESRAEWNRMLPLVFWRWHTAAGEAGKLYLKEQGVFATSFTRQRVSTPGQHGGAEVRFGTLTLDEADRQEMLTILQTMGGPPY